MKQNITDKVWTNSERLFSSIQPIDGYTMLVQENNRSDYFRLNKYYFIYSKPQQIYIDF